MIHGRCLGLAYKQGGGYAKYDQDQAKARDRL